jgi:hypothetical protein
MGATKRPPCVIGKYCKDHDFIHGAEAEELREAIEQLEASTLDAVLATTLRRLLDRIDARDSLSWCERRRQEKAREVRPRHFEAEHIASFETHPPSPACGAPRNGEVMTMDSARASCAKCRRKAREVRRG